MRIFKPKAKIEKTIEIPDNLKEFFQYVHHEICELAEETQIEPDDLLQCEFAYGGLINEETREFGFTYFPGKGIENKWEIVLNATEISEICNNEKKHLKLWECVNSKCESLFQTKDENCFYCDYVEVEPILPKPELLLNKFEWGKEFFKLNPDAKGFHLRTVVQYNSELQNVFNDFNSEEIDMILKNLEEKNGR
jgi:hypothetical protein